MAATLPKPEWMPLKLRCGQCSMEFDGWQPVKVPVTLWLAHIRLLRCPNCHVGPRALYLRTEGR